MVAAEGLQEVQAHPTHAEKVTVDSEFRDRNVFIFYKMRWEGRAGVHVLLQNRTA